jgi:hypothetical protein
MVITMDKTWKNNYYKILAYKRLNGHFAILFSDVKNKRLRDWYQKQIFMYKNNQIKDADIYIQVSTIFDHDLYGVKWENWEKSFRKLQKYYLKNGNSNVSQLVQGIGPWLSAQRVSYRRNELSETKIKMLEDISVSWNPSDKNEKRWFEQFNLLKSFFKENNHSNVPRREMPNPGIWVSAQRTSYRKGLLSKEKINKLESLNFQWKLK